MAEKGIFNKQGLTPIESVYNANLYDVLQYISVNSAKEVYKIEYQNVNNERPKRKK